MSFDNVAMFHPHTDIPYQAIIELLNVRCPPDVPAKHHRAKSTTFAAEKLRPYLERVGDYLVLIPADERRAREIYMLRSLPEILDDLSKFNQEPPFPSCCDPLSTAELSKEIEMHFPSPPCVPSPDEAEWPLPLLDTGGWEQFAVGEAGNDAQGAAQEHLELDPLAAAFPTAPTALGAQWHDAPTPITGWPTPLPDYESPLSAPEELERDNEAFWGATHTLPPFYQTPHPAEAAPLPSALATQAQPQHQPATAVYPSASAIPAPRAMIPSAQFTFQAHSSNAGPSTLPAAVSSSAPVQEPAPAPAFFTTQFRGAFDPVMYTGPPQKSTRKAPRKIAGKSKSKAAGKSAPK